MNERRDEGAAATEAQAQYLTFRLGNEEYGIDILRVQEIKGWSGATPMPQAPAHVLGVINLRGLVVPIVDLRRRFELPPAEFGPTTVVIVVRVMENDAARVVGLVVDAVAEVYQLAASAVKPPPELGEAAREEFVRGLASVEDKMIILLDVDRLVALSGVYSNSAAQAA